MVVLKGHDPQVPFGHLRLAYKPAKQLKGNPFGICKTCDGSIDLMSVEKILKGVIILLASVISWFTLLWLQCLGYFKGSEKKNCLA